MNVPRVILLAALLLFAQTYLAREWLTLLLLLAALVALGSFLRGVYLLVRGRMR
jgi:hypothetical protein